MREDASDIKPSSHQAIKPSSHYHSLAVFWLEPEKFSIQPSKSTQRPIGLVALEKNRSKADNIVIELRCIHFGHSQRATSEVQLEEIG